MLLNGRFIGRYTSPGSWIEHRGKNTWIVVYGKKAMFNPGRELAMSEMTDFMAKKLIA